MTTNASEGTASHHRRIGRYRELFTPIGWPAAATISSSLRVMRPGFAVLRTKSAPGLAAAYRR